MKKITIKDIAKDAGVSISIASFALNDVKGRVSHEVRQKVLESSSRLGYIPNAAARNLRTKSINTIVLMYDELYLEERNSSTLQFVAGALKHASDNGKDILLKLVNSDKGWERAVKESCELWLSQKAEGIIFLTNRINEKSFCEIQKHGVNFVMIPPLEKNYLFNSVYIDNFRLMSEGVEFINQKGYKEAYFLTMRTERQSEREIGFLQAIKKYGISGRVLYYEHFYRDKGELWGLLKTVIEDSKNKIAIACWNDVDAMNVIDILHSNGIKIPDEVGVMGFDDLPASEHTQPPLTTIRQPFDKMAQIAVDLVLSNFRDKNHTGCKCIDAGGSLIVRESV